MDDKDEALKKKETLEKEALDALSVLDDKDRQAAYDYFESLIRFHKHASLTKRS